MNSQHNILWPCPAFVFVLKCIADPNVPASVVFVFRVWKGQGIECPTNTCLRLYRLLIR